MSGTRPFPIFRETKFPIPDFLEARLPPVTVFPKSNFRFPRERSRSDAILLNQYYMEHDLCSMI